MKKKALLAYAVSSLLLAACGKNDSALYPPFLTTGYDTLNGNYSIKISNNNLQWANDSIL